MIKTLIKIAGSNEFFERGRKIAKLADRGQPIRKSHLITFEDSDDIASLITVSNINLLSAIREKPSTIAARQRDCNATLVQ